MPYVCDFRIIHNKYDLNFASSYGCGMFVECRAVQQLELKVGESWLQQIRYVMSSPTRVAKLMTGVSDRGINAEVPTTEQPTLVSPRTLDVAGLQAAQKMTYSSHTAVTGNKEVENQENETILAVHHQTDPSKLEEQSQKESAKSRSILFRPLRNRTVKNVDKEKPTFAEMDVPLDVIPRLNFDFQGDEKVGAMVPM